MQGPIKLAVRQLHQMAETLGESNATIWDGSGTKPNGIYVAFSRDINGNKKQLFIKVENEEDSMEVGMLKAWRDSEIKQYAYTHGSSWNIYSIHEFIMKNTSKWSVDSNLRYEHIELGDVDLWFGRTIINTDVSDPSSDNFVPVCVLEIGYKKSKFGYMLFITKEEEEDFTHWFINELEGHGGEQESL